MIEIYKRDLNDLSVINIGPFNIYDNGLDRPYFKNVINKIFETGDEIFFYFRREESLTDEEELEVLRESVFKKITEQGRLLFLNKIDQSRFEGIATIKFDCSDTPNFIVDAWKYFYSLDFFKPINDLSFEEYEDYLEVNGVNDIDGLKLLRNRLTDCICIKGLGADHLVISYKSELCLEDKL